MARRTEGINRHKMKNRGAVGTGMMGDYLSGNYLEAQ